MKTGDTDTKHELLRQKNEKNDRKKRESLTGNCRRTAREQNTKKIEKKIMARVDSTFAKLASS